jgi:hypothetical protein
MTDANDSQSIAEATDPSKLGETVGQEDRPGDDYPPDEPLGVEDPSILGDGRIAPDDVETRSQREQPERFDEPLVATQGDDADGAAEVAAVHEVAEEELR